MNFASRRHKRYCLPTLRGFRAVVVGVFLSAGPVLHANVCREFSGQWPAEYGNAEISVPGFGTYGMEQQVSRENHSMAPANAVWTACEAGWHHTTWLVRGRINTKVLRGHGDQSVFEQIQRPRYVLGFFSLRNMRGLILRRATSAGTGVPALCDYA